MILIDAIYINNSGGKVLLDYLICKLEATNMRIHYLLDNRIKDNHPHIKISNKVSYLDGNLLKRHLFYQRNKNKYSKVLCFNNIPPTLKLKSPVYTYFHQPLFINAPSTIPLSQKVVIYLKTMILNIFKYNTDLWIVQSNNIKHGLIKKYKIKNRENVDIIPFYPSIKKCSNIAREKYRFIYVSGGAHHKNHLRLINAFVIFYDHHKTGELHLTIGDEFTYLCEMIDDLKNNGYPIINHGFLKRDELCNLYASSEYSIYPSLTESFGLGIIEAIEHGCKIIGADRPYMYAVCEPSLTFNPESNHEIVSAMENAFLKDCKPTIQRIFDETVTLLKLLGNDNV